MTDAENLLRELRIAHKLLVIGEDTRDEFIQKSAEICDESNNLDANTPSVGVDEVAVVLPREVASTLTLNQSCWGSTTQTSSLTPVTKPSERRTTMPSNEQRIYDFNDDGAIIDTRTGEVVADEFCGPKEARNLANRAIQGERERVNGLAAEVFGDPKATWGNMIGARGCFGRVEITVASEKQVYRHSYVLDETTEFDEPTGNISYDGDTFLEALEAAATPENEQEG